MRIMLSDPAKVVWKVAHGLMDMITKTKIKNITKNKSVIFSCSLS